MKMRASLARVSGCAVLGAIVIFAFAMASFRNGRNHGGSAGALSLLAESSPIKGASQQGNAEILKSYGKLPLSFEENLGQTDPRVRFVSRGEGYELFLTPREAVLSLRSAQPTGATAVSRLTHFRTVRQVYRSEKSSVLRLQFEGANPDARIDGLNKLAGRTDYFIGSNPKDWRTDVPSYGRVSYREIYPGVDLVFHGNQRRLEYDFVVAPGADPKAIAFNVEGARKLEINSQGNLVMSVPAGKVELEKPAIYQAFNGARRQVSGKYVLASNHQVRFDVAQYDSSSPLVIDPVLNYSTYLGGSATGDAGFGIAVDGLGDAYIAGQTFSTTFPTANGFTSQPVPSNPNGAVFVTELDPTGTTELYSTYLIGTDTGGEAAFGIALDATGNIYVTGQTFSTGFPTKNGLTISGNAANGIAFVSKINPALPGGANSLLYSTYLGGTTPLSATVGGESANAIAADAAGNAYVAGFTDSTDFPIQGGYQTAPDPANVLGSAFLTRIDTTKSGAASLIYSTYLGGNGANGGAGDQAIGVAVDSSANAYVTGSTTSTNFPVKNAYQAAPTAGNTVGTAFVSRIDTGQTGSSSLIYSTYLGGSKRDAGFPIALGPNNVAYVTGFTTSSDFPVTAGAYDTAAPASITASGSAFVTLIDTSKSGNASLAYSTFLGGGADIGWGIKADVLGNAYVAGGTASTLFPITPGAFQTKLAAGSQGDAFVAKLNPAGKGSADLVYSTYFGGSGAGNSSDVANSIAIDAANNAYITGETFSTAATFPVYPPSTATPPAFQTSLTGSDAASTAAAFAAKLTLIPTITVLPTSIAFGAETVGVPTAAQTVTITNNTTASVTYTSSFAAGAPPAADTDFKVASDPCGGTVAANGGQCLIGVTFTPSVAAAETANLVITDSDASNPTTTIGLSGSGSAGAPVALSPSPLTFTGQIVGTTSAAQTVTLTNNTGAPVTNVAIGINGGTEFTQTNTCGTSVATGDTCTISVKFAPTGTTNPRTATLSVSYMGNGSPQTVNLSGTGWDFGLSAPASSSVPKGGSGPVVLTVTPLGGFNQAVSLSCTTTIPKGSCSIPASVTPADGVTPVTATATIKTTGASFAPPQSVPIPPPSAPQIVLAMAAMCLLLMLPAARQFRTRLAMAIGMVVFIVLAGCSGSSGTPKGTYSVTLTGTSGGATHTATVALTVN